MTTSFPGALDSLPRPLPTTLRNAPGLNLSGVIDNVADAVEAVQAKLGTGASTAASNQVLRGTGAGTSAFGAIQTADLAAAAITQVDVANGSTVDPTTTSATPARIPQMVVTLTTTGGPCLIVFTGVFQHSVAGGTIALDINVDTALQLRREFQVPVANQSLLVSLAHSLTPVAGSRTLEIMWLTTSGTAKAFSNQRGMTVVELKR